MKFLLDIIIKMNGDFWYNRYNWRSFQKVSDPSPPEGGRKARPGPDFRQVRRQDHLLPADAAGIRQGCKKPTTSSMR